MTAVIHRSRRLFPTITALQIYLLSVSEQIGSPSNSQGSRDNTYYKLPFNKMFTGLLPLPLMASTVAVGCWREENLRYRSQTALGGFPRQSSLLRGEPIKELVSLPWDALDGIQTKFTQATSFSPLLPQPIDFLEMLLLWGRDSPRAA